jgi:hypothetical protein
MGGTTSYETFSFDLEAGLATAPVARRGKPMARTVAIPSGSVEALTRIASDRFLHPVEPATATGRAIAHFAWSSPGAIRLPWRALAASHPAPCAGLERCRAAFAARDRREVVLAFLGTRTPTFRGC